MSQVPSSAQSLLSHSLFSVRNKVVVITGGTRGIGLSIAQGFLMNGVSKVYVCSRKKEACVAIEKQVSEFMNQQKLDKKPQFIALQADLSNMKGIESFCEQITDDKVHVLVNNSGTNWAESIDSYPEDAWDKVMDLNLKTPFFVIQKLLPKLRNAATLDAPASIINIGSINGVNAPNMDTFAYATSKAGLHHLTKHLALRLASDHICVNALACGFFFTKMTKQTFEDFGDHIMANIPLGRQSRASDVAGAALFLASPAASWMTGNVIALDGGSIIKSNL
ncbi:hypothetical protein C9374_004794 [Naegleria lovaniensis]|uniref:Uncharacterized protein n=1 Tax=Naegleria lovaniensis TaxID=51637 RepID=A0AA88GQV0_NAELO|nr:uncharacterized protein C9374_004794 [Naegleria lovaniensis]KAG2382827.1 hypothetical protein C9374_004794 [Naegleria lovaniensis]